MPTTNSFGDVIEEPAPQTNAFGDAIEPAVEDRASKRARLIQEKAAIPTTSVALETLKQYPSSFSELGQSPLTLPDEDTNAAIDRIIERGSDLITPIFGRPELSKREAVGQLAKGGAHLLKSGVDFLTSPKGMAATAAQLTPIAPAVNAYLAAETAGQVPEAARRAGEVSVTGTPDERAAAYTDLAGAVATPGLLALGVGKPDFNPPKLTPQDFARATIETPKEEPLGVLRPAKFNDQLPKLEEPALTDEFKAAERDVLRLEKLKDEGADTPEFRSELGAAQDRLTSVELEKFRRDANEIDSRDLFRKLRDRLDSVKNHPDSQAAAEGRILIGIMRDRGVKGDEIAGDMGALTPDQAEILRGDLETIKAQAMDMPKEPSVAENPPPTEAELPPISPKSLSDVDKVFTEVPKQPGRGMVKEAIESVRRNLFSGFRPASELETQVRRAANLPTDVKQEFARDLELIKGAGGKAEADMLRFDADVADKVKGAEKDFNAYLFLKRAEDRLSQDPTVKRVEGYDLPQVRSLLEEVQWRSGNKWNDIVAAGDAYQTHLDDALRLQVDSGRLSPEMYAKIKDSNDFYAPYRVMKYLDDADKASPGTGRRIDTTAELSKAITGIHDPDFRLGDMLAAGRAQIARSRVLAEKNTKLQRLGELAKLDTNGDFVRLLGNDEKPKFGKGAVNVMENGDVKRYEVDKEFAEAIQQHSSPTSNMLIELARPLGMPFRLGATGMNSAFQLKNFAMDQARHATMAKTGPEKLADVVQYPLDIIHALYSSVRGNSRDFGLKPDTLYMDFLDSGAAGATLQKYLIPEALRPEKAGRIKKTAATMANGVASISNAIEETTKILGFKRAMRMTGAKSGAELAEKFPEMVTEVRRFAGSPDFARQGNLTQAAYLNVLYPFFNARLQGAALDLGRLVGRDGREAQAKALVRLGGAVALPTVALWMFNQRPENREDYDKRTPQERDNWYLFPKYNQDGSPRYIKDDQGNDVRDYWRFPKKDITQLTANVTEGGLQFMRDRDPEALQKLALGTIEDLSPLNIKGKDLSERMESIASGAHSWLKAWIESATGRDLYKHRNIVPDKLKDVDPKEQFTDYTPDVFKKISAAMPEFAPEILRSPLRLENLTRNLSGNLVTQFIPAKPVTGRTPTENNAIVRLFEGSTKTDDSAFQDEVKKLRTEEATEQVTRDRALRDIVKANPSFKDGLRATIAKFGTDQRALRRAEEMYRAASSGETQQDRQLLALDAKRRAEFIVNELSKKTPEQAADYRRQLIQRRLISPAVLVEMERLREAVPNR